MCTRKLEIEVSEAKYDFCIFRTDETRYKQVNSLKVCKHQRLLACGELGASLTTF